MDLEKISTVVHLYCPRCKSATSGYIPFCEKCDFDIQFGNVKHPKKINCAYCGELRKPSDEHVYGKWIRVKYPVRHARTKHILVRPDYIQDFEPSNYFSNHETIPRSLYDIVIRNVCKSCNNDWMSKLQNDAKFIVEDLASGIWRELDSANQIILSRWVTMVAINLSYWSRQPVVTTSQRKALMSGDMPPGIRISFNRMENEITGGVSRTTTIKSHGVAGLYGQIVYFCIERVVFYCVLGQGENSLSLLQKHASPNSSLIEKYGPTMRTLWPINASPSLRNETFFRCEILDALVNNTYIP